MLVHCIIYIIYLILDRSQFQMSPLHYGADIVKLECNLNLM